MAIDERSSTAPRYQTIRFDCQSPLALIVIDRAAQANALDLTCIGELAEAFQRAGQDPAIRVVILTGTGENFASGPALTELTELTASSAQKYAQRGQALMDQIEQLGKPVLAAINGNASGAGLELALACTLRVATAQTKLIFSAVKLGLIAGFGGHQRLTRLVGLARALELVLTAAAIDAETGYQIGLINRITAVAELFSETRELAQRISNQPPLAIKYSLEALINGIEMPREDSQFLEATLFALCYVGDDLRESLRQFLSQRPMRIEKK